MRLEVSRSELSEALEQLPTISPILSSCQAQLFFDGTRLIVKAPASSFEINATGVWQQVARVPLQFFYGLRGKLPEDQMIEIKSAEDQIWFNNLSVGASWQNGVYDDFPLSVDAQISDALRARKALSEDQLKRSGLSTMANMAMVMFNDFIDISWEKISPEIEKLGLTKGEFRATLLGGL